MLKLSLLTTITLFQFLSFSANKIKTINHYCSDFQSKNQDKDSLNCKLTPLFQSFLDSVTKNQCFVRKDHANIVNVKYLSGIDSKIKFGCQLQISSKTCGTLDIHEWQLPSAKEAEDALRYIQTYEYKFKNATYSRNGKYPLASMRVGAQIYIFVSVNGSDYRPHNPIPQYLNIMKALSAPKEKKDKTK